METFSDTRTVGAVISKRNTEFILSVWHRNCSQLDTEEFGSRIRDLLRMEITELVYKPFAETIRDGSTRWTENGRSQVSVNE